MKLTRNRIIWDELTGLESLWKLPWLDSEKFYWLLDLTRDDLRLDGYRPDQSSTGLYASLTVYHLAIFAINPQYENCKILLQPYLYLQPCCKSFKTHPREITIIRYSTVWHKYIVIEVRILTLQPSDICIKTEREISTYWKKITRGYFGNWEVIREIKVVIQLETWSCLPDILRAYFFVMIPQK